MGVPHQAERRNDDDLTRTNTVEHIVETSKLELMMMMVVAMMVVMVMVMMMVMMMLMMMMMMHRHGNHHKIQSIICFFSPITLSVVRLELVNPFDSRRDIVRLAGDQLRRCSEHCPVQYVGLQPLATVTSDCAQDCRHLMFAEELSGT